MEKNIFIDEEHISSWIPVSGTDISIGRGSKIENILFEACILFVPCCLYNNESLNISDNYSNVSCMNFW